MEFCEWFVRYDEREFLPACIAWFDEANFLIVLSVERTIGTGPPKNPRVIEELLVALVYRRCQLVRSVLQKTDSTIFI
jgi:hypothetical protein